MWKSCAREGVAHTHLFGSMLSGVLASLPTSRIELRFS